MLNDMAYRVLQQCSAGKKLLMFLVWNTLSSMRLHMRDVHYKLDLQLLKNTSLHSHLETLLYNRVERWWPQLLCDLWGVAMRQVVCWLQCYVMQYEWTDHSIDSRGTELLQIAGTWSKTHKQQSLPSWAWTVVELVRLQFLYKAPNSRMLPVYHFTSLKVETKSPLVIWSHI